MKKTLTVLLLAGLTFTIASCKKNNNDDPDEPEIVYTVTKEEFDAASNLRYKNLTYKGVLEASGEETMRVEMKFLADGSSQQVEAGGWGNILYKVEADNTVSYIRHADSEEDVWYVDQIRTKEAYEQGNYGDDVGLISFIDGLKGHYDDFTYYDASHSYKGKLHNEMLDVDYDYDVIFENKEIALMTISGEYMGETATTTVTVINRGTTTIDFDSLHYVNNIGVAGKTFTFTNGSISSFSPEDQAAFNDGNQLSTITFYNDGTFTMTMVYDFVSPHGEQSYNGTYTFNKFEKTFDCSINVYGTDYNSSGHFMLDNENYTSGGIIHVNIADTPMGNIELSFKIQ